MIWKNALKYPVLIVGVILFGLYLSSPNTKEFWRKIDRRYKPSTCDVTKDRIQPKAPSNWSFECETVQLLIVNIDYDKKISGSLGQRQQLYMDLANYLVKLGQFSNLETMEYLRKIRMNLHTENLTIESITDGKTIVKLTNARDKKNIARLLKIGVKIKEVKK